MCLSLENTRNLLNKYINQKLWYFSVQMMYLNLVGIFIYIWACIYYYKVVTQLVFTSSFHSILYAPWDSLCKNISLTHYFCCWFSFSLINIPSLIYRPPHPSFLPSFSQISLLNEIPNSCFIRKCDICEIWWERMRLKILIL